VVFCPPPGGPRGRGAPGGVGQAMTLTRTTACEANVVVLPR
jgi:hypothetical protein